MIIRKEYGDWNLTVDITHGSRIVNISYKDEPNFFWSPPQTHSIWKAGGHRTWLAPELGEHGFFGYKNGTPWTIPTSFDPGNYYVYGENQDEIISCNDFSLFNQANDLFVLTLKKQVSVSSWSDTSIVLSITSTIINKGQKVFPTPIGIWEILQLPSHSKASVNIYTKQVASLRNCKVQSDYPLPGYLQIYRNSVIYSSFNQTIAKGGMPPREATGSLEYNDIKEKHIIRYSTLESPNPLHSYPDKPTCDMSSQGDAVQLYMSGVAIDPPFCELELHSKGLLLESEQEYSFSTSLHCIRYK